MTLLEEVNWSMLWRQNAFSLPLVRLLSHNRAFFLRENSAPDKVWWREESYCAHRLVLSGDWVESSHNETEYISIAQKRRLAEIDAAGKRRLWIPHKQIHTHAHTLSTGGPLGQEWSMTLCPQNWQQVPAVSKKKLILKALPESQQLGVMESNLKFGWDWPSSTRINENVQRENASKKWDNNVLCLVILPTKCATSQVVTLGATERRRRAVKRQKLAVLLHLAGKITSEGSNTRWHTCKYLLS